MKILLLLSETWNDVVHPNNNMSNWFENISDLEIFTISCGPELPNNNCCKNYFILNDKSMAKSLFSTIKAGTILKYDDYPHNGTKVSSNTESIIYRRRKNLHKISIQLLREFIWRFGKINTSLLTEFILSANPDIIFSQRMGSVKMCSLERRILNIINKPIVAYTGDNEYLQDGLPSGFLKKIKVLWVRKWLNRMIPLYSIYYCMSKEQMSFYSNTFHVKTKFLIKSGDFNNKRIHNMYHKPIKLLYAGKLYCGRDNTLALLSEEIEKINVEHNLIVFTLDIFTSDISNSKLTESLNNAIFSTIHPSISPLQLSKIYDNYDIVLHVEGLDAKNVLTTKYSFSTKIMDLLSSGCAVMTICNSMQAGFEFLKTNDIAFAASDKKEIQRILLNIAEYPNTIIDYANKAYKFGSNHHSKLITQQSLLEDFRNVIDENNSNKCCQ